MRRNQFLFQVSMLGLVVLLISVFGCKKDNSKDDKNPDNEFVISDVAKFIDSDSWQSSFISLDSSTYSYTFNSTFDKYSPKVGDILVSTYGEGMLRIISDVQVINGNYFIQTTQGSITDLILNGKIHLDTTLSVASIKSINYASDRVKLTNAYTRQTEDTLFQFDIDSLVIYDYDSDPQTKYDQIILNGGLGCTWNFVIDIDISIFEGLKEVKVGFESSEDLDLEMFSRIGYQFEKEISLATIHFSPIIVPLSIPPFAVIFTPVFDLNTGISGFAQAAITTTVDQGITFDAGIHYLKATGWNTYTDFDKHFDFEPPYLTIDAGAKAFIKPEFIVKIYGVVGPYVNMEGYLRLDANLLEIPWWELYGGFNMNAGVKAVIFSKVLFNVTFSDLISYEVLLLQANSGFNATPVALFTVFPESGGPATLFYFDASASYDIEDPADELEVRWDWESDGTWDADWNQAKTISYQFPGIGEYLVGMEVKDSQGLSDTSSIMVPVSDTIGNQAPNQPHNPSPPNVASDIEINPTLEWLCEDPDNDPLVFDIYFGTATPPDLIQSNASEFSFLPGTLDYNKAYYWRIIAKDDHNHITAGPIWSFVTQPSGSGNGVPCPGLPTVVYEGVTYNTVFIGSQCWLKENLNVGLMILNTLNQSDNQAMEKYCYLNQAVNCELHGGLYQWDELMQYSGTPGATGICPPGWHVPTDENWKDLEAFLGMNPGELDLTGWRGTDQGTQLMPNGLTGFDALLSGIYNLGFFSDLDVSGYYFTSSSVTSTNSWSRTFSIEQAGVGRYQTLKQNAVSARCLKD